MVGTAPLLPEDIEYETPESLHKILNEGEDNE